MSWARRSFATLALASFLAALTYLVYAALEAAADEEPADIIIPAPERVREPVRAPASPRRGRIVWRNSRSLGLPWSGRLIGAVQLPAENVRFYTWDPVRKRAPNRAWRRWATDRLVRTILRVLARVDAPQRIGIGDLSRPNGGDFGPRFGLPGHASHQNGLDVDIYLPRRDRRERPPARPGQVDRRLAQRLVDAFVASGAAKVFVGFGSGLRGPPDVVQAIPNHETHLHVRLPAP